MTVTATSVFAIAAPWEATLTNTQHQLITFMLSFAALALLAGLVRTIATRGEVGSRYRSATVARLGIMSVASASYAMILIAFTAGYNSSAAGWVPNERAIDTFALRYVEWALTVPLLCAELLAVTTLIGAVADRTRYLAMGGAFAMIFTGFIGGVIIDSGRDPAQTLIWFAVSAVFWILTTTLLVRTVRASIPGLTPDAGKLLVWAAIVLLGGWVIYPTVALIQVFAAGGEWTTLMHIGFSLADVAVKVGFAGIIHRVAKFRTAEDVRAGHDMHTEAIWISSVKLSDAGVARVVHLAEEATIHRARLEPAKVTAHASADERPSHEAVARNFLNDDFG